MIKVIAFDFAGVIVNSPLREYFEKRNLDKSIYKRVTGKWDLGELTEEEVYRHISEHINFPTERIYKEIFGLVVPNKSLIRFIRNLKNNYRIALFSNNVSSLVMRLLDKHDIVDLFDTILISSDHKMVKPDPAYFHKLLSILSVSSDEVIFIDDTRINVDAGNKLGIKSILFTSLKELENKLQSLGVKV